MKKFLLLIFILMMAPSLVSCKQNTNRYELISSDPEMSIYLDMQSIAYNKAQDLAKYWIKVVYTPEGKQARLQPIQAVKGEKNPIELLRRSADYNLTLLEIKVSDRRYRSAEFIYYNNEGKELNKLDTPTSWSNIKPHTLGEKMLLKALPVINQQE